MKYAITVTFILLALLSGCSSVLIASEQRVYELRTYTAEDGKIGTLNANFENYTIEFFTKHGIKSHGYWVPVEQPDTLIYLVSHESMEAMKKNWQNLTTDPEWRAILDNPDRISVLAKKPETIVMLETDYSRYLEK